MVVFNFAASFGTRIGSFDYWRQAVTQATRILNFPQSHAQTTCLIHLLNPPFDSKTRTHNVLARSARRRADGGAGRRWAEQGADRPSGVPAHCEQLFWISFRNHQKKSYVNCWGNKMSSWRPVFYRFIRGYHRDRERASLLAVDQWAVDQCTDANLFL